MTRSNSENGTHTLNKLGESALKKYARLLTRLLFSVMRTLNLDVEASPKCKERYPPLAALQSKDFVKLYDALIQNLDDDIEDAYHRACFALFAHEQHQYPDSVRHDKFFSPVNCFVVYVSVRHTGEFDKPSVMTGTMAAIEYAIRGTILVQIYKDSAGKGIAMTEYILFSPSVMRD